ncbi:MULTISPECIES: hypothetical protein [unclassified Photobacterium]|uniref:hypothetical protein n=1 Tax=unclassified Photobacterium TaxID=2628852 RepID=UPI000D16803F|nr:MULTISPECIES: hypothetical protein [unclassified Photobacterium]PSV26247.1 hypothetical protein C9J42_13170 [Photobacterium sp. GB-56]PSV26802.1 hypothetical protein C9J40_20655 [Photobacterium sp. GB-72]PSV34350.1 hypothetical protein C9J38_18635 [Photobacterium sp. GB-210]PSV38212.1 hypothetical protein C9J44_04030 [Photobacterium sp. GB-27]PSV45854.1 hypothetical protein C9J46_04885 [Photobacterium sp. GB-36]
MRSTVLKNIRQRSKSLLELVESLEPSLLEVQLDVPKSKSIGEHMWCIVGARESYARSLLVGKWDGFTCSLENTNNLLDIVAKLKSSEVKFEEAVTTIKSWTEERDDLLVDLLEHESMHEGQLIRHVYALKQEVPKSVKWA